MGLFGYNGEIGLSEEKITSLLQKCDEDAQVVIDTLGKNMQLILDKLGEEWGTVESKSNVDTDIKPGLEKAQQTVAAQLKAIGDTIRATAVQQAMDTNNDFSGLPTPKEATVVTLVNKQQSVLESGYVGAVATLEKDVQAVTINLQSEVATKLNFLKSNLVEAANTAFLDEGKTVANKASEYILAVNESLKSAIRTLLDSISTYTADVVKYEQSIQGEWVQVEAQTQ